MTKLLTLPATLLLLVAVACLSHAQIITDQTCHYSVWSSWSTCNQTDCSGGWQVRRRTLDGGDFTCNAALSEIRACNSCRKDCKWSTWTEWSKCSAACGMGSRTRTRYIVQQSEYGGRVCSGNASEVTACKLEDCSIACEWTTWSEWTPCSHQCGGGVRSRWITNQRNESMDDETFEEFDVECDTNATMFASCNTMSCYECEWGEWSLWSECTSATNCGEGQQMRTRNVTRGSIDGSPCDNYWENSHEYFMCDLGKCPDSVATIKTHLNTIAIVAGVVGFVVLVALAVVLFFHCRGAKTPLKMPWNKSKPEREVPEPDSDMKVVELTEPN